MDGRASDDPERAEMPNNVGDGIVSYAWDVGDHGTIDELGARAELAPTATGPLHVRLVVHDAQGVAGETTPAIEVPEAPRSRRLGSRPRCPRRRPPSRRRPGARPPPRRRRPSRTVLRPSRPPWTRLTTPTRRRRARGRMKPPTRCPRSRCRRAAGARSSSTPTWPARATSPGSTSPPAGRSPSTRWRSPSRAEPRRSPTPTTCSRSTLGPTGRGAGAPMRSSRGRT